MHPGDDGGNNIYQLSISANDGTNTTFHSIVITVTDVDDTNPVFTSGTSASFVENETTTVYTVVATDANALTYSLGTGNDEALFDINSTSGAVTFKTAPDFEMPADADQNNSYVINVIASDGINAVNQNVTITVTNVDDTAPVFTSASAIGYAENGTGKAYTAVATDANTITYSLGVDGDEVRFNIDRTSGIVTFKSSPDFENPADTNADNDYLIAVAASDGINTAYQNVTITVTDVDEIAPVFTSASSTSFAENGTGAVYTAVATDANTITYSLGSDGDEPLFNIDGTSGAITFKTTPDFENPADDNASNDYLILVIANDGMNVSEQQVTITVTDVDEIAPVFTSATTVSFVENGTETAYTALATDANALTYSLGMGNDETLFTIDGSTGAVTFKAAPDFENPLDGNADNAYMINVIASDGINAVNQDVTINVTDADEIAPTVNITSSANGLTNAMFTVTLAYSEQVIGFELADLTVSNGTASNFQAIVSGQQWTADITPSADGVVTVGIAAGMAADASGNANTAAQSFTINSDLTAPSVTLTAATTTAVNGKHKVTAAFSENVNGFTEADVTVTDGSLANFNTIDAKTYEFEVSSEGGIALVNIAQSMATDVAGNGNTAAQQLSLLFNNLPTDITLSNSSITENNAAGAMIGAFTSIDQDAADTHSYELVSGDGDADNASFSLAGNELQASASFDYEVKTSYSIRVKTTDNKGGSFEKAFTISIENILESDITLSGDVTFDMTPLGLTATKQLTITNVGEKSTVAIVFEMPKGFTISSNSTLIEVGKTETLQVYFNPLEAGIHQGELTFNYDGNRKSINLTGEGAIVTSVDDGLLDDTDIKLYPNPARELLTIDLRHLSNVPIDITMVDGQGRAVFAHKGFAADSLQLNVSDYKSGMYLIKFTDGKSVAHKKVIIRK